MEEGEHKLCLVEVPLELMEETLLQVQVQLLEEMEHREALEAEAALGEEADSALCLPPLLIQEEMEASVQQEVMEAEAVEVEVEGASILVAPILQEREVQEVLAVLEAAAEAAEVLE